MMTAILMVPLLACAGLAVDFSTANDVKAQLQGAADAAAIGAISTKSDAVDDAATMGDGVVVSGGSTAKTLFTANLSGSAKTDLTDYDATVTKSGMELNSQVTFAADVPMNFMRIFGIDTFHVSGTAQATIRTAAFMDFYLLLDNTPSMGVGATKTDVDKMVSLTSDRCAFACHEADSTGKSTNANDYYTLAKKNGVTMRIDVVRDAVKDLMDTAGDPTIQKYTNQFRMAIYTFGTSADTMGLTEVSALTTDLQKSQTLANKIDLMTIPYNNYKNDELTSYDSALTKLNAKIGTPGSGVTSSQPQKWVLMVGDGVGDSSKASTCTKRTTGDRCQEPIDTSFCQTLKSRGVNIAVLYTTYLPLPTNDWYNSWIAPFQSEINPRMAACATPGYFFEVSPTEGISDAMNALFKKIVLTPRITS